MQQNSQKPTNQQKDMTAILSYLGILVLVPLLAKKENDFCQYHAKQGLVLFVAEIITMVIVWVPFIGWIIGFLAWIAWVVLSLIGIINVANGKQKALPIVGSFAKKF